VSAQIEALRGGGQPLSKPIRAAFEPRFGYDLGQVRVHTDARAAKLAQKLNARAFAVGSDIAFSAHAYTPETREGLRLLAHELTHTLQNRGSRRAIHLWGARDHRELTQTAARGILSDALFLAELTQHTFSMDITPSKLAFALGFIKGEGPKHGEDGNYTETSPGRAAAQNIAVQDAYVCEAFRHQQTARSLERAGAPVHDIGDATARMFWALANACHVAQDRGAHGEGVKRQGHDDPRVRVEGWNPDNPSDNWFGYRCAVNNTKDVLQDWKSIGGRG
jgi:hypothetical protein